MNWPFVITGFIGAFIVGFIIGWEISVHRFRANQNELRDKYLRLKREIDEILGRIGT